MKTLPYIMTLVLGMALLQATGCSSLERGGAGDDDATTIERNIMDRLTRDDATRTRGLGVRVQNGVATVYGTVPNDMVRARTINVVENTEGVTDVRDEMKVLSFSSFE